MSPSFYDDIPKNPNNIQHKHNQKNGRSSNKTEKENSTTLFIFLKNKTFTQTINMTTEYK